MEKVPTKIKHQKRLIQSNRFAAVAIGYYGFYEIGKVIFITHIYCKS